MRKKNSFFNLKAILAVSAFLGMAAAAGAQDSYVFASPNTKASLTDEVAQANLASPEELNAIAVADRIACSMTDDAEISPGLGVYDSSSENSLLIESNIKPDQTEYLASLLGKYERQEFILIFSPQAAGHDRLWTIRTPEEFPAAASAARQLHLTPLTVRHAEDEIEIWIVDTGDKFGDRPQQLAAQLNGSASSREGATELLGDDDRTKAAAVFDAKIFAFERRTKLTLSSLLATPAWRNASTRTCSTEVPY